MIGDWMQTYTGRPFWPLDPRPDDVDIRDIAHALSLACRFGGHSLRFYSVAEHCVLLARAVAPASKKWALMHDASEAYIVDVPRPLKPHLTNYKTAEAAVMLAIAQRFGLGECPADVKDADDRILHDERAQVMGPCVADWTMTSRPPLGVVLQLWAPVDAERAFLETYLQLFPAEGSQQ